MSQLREELLQCIKIKLFLQPSGRLTPFLDLAICPCTSRLQTTFDRREPIGACSNIICLVLVLVFLFDSDEAGLRKFVGSNVIAIARLPDLVRRQAIASGTLVKPAFCRFYSTPALGDKRRVVSVASQKTRNRIYKTLKYVSSGLEIL